MTKLVRTRADLAAARAQLPEQVGVVMTMGALHHGHAELVRHAFKRCESVIVTIFVNPLQFGDATDLERYPRTLAADLERCDELGVDVVFAPTVEEMYAAGQPRVTVSAGELATRFEGADRPGHFDGVLTVVSKLLHLTRPDIAVFGEKDAQQLALIRRMVDDLDFDVRIVGVDTVREVDGLALSSRNVRLTAEQRHDALALSRALQVGAALAGEGPAAVLAAARDILAGAPGVEPSYLELVDDQTWQPATDGTTKARLIVAARVGEVRLIDNLPLTLPALAMFASRTAA